MAWSCPKCAAKFTPGEKFCASCGYRLVVGGTDDEPAPRPILDYADPDTRKKIRAARTIILIVAVVNVGFAIFLHFKLQADLHRARDIVDVARANPDIDRGAVAFAHGEVRKFALQIRINVMASALVAVAYVACWLWGKVSPLPAILCALVLYLALQALEFAVNPIGLRAGLLWRILIVTGLVSGVIAAAGVRRPAPQGA